MNYIIENIETLKKKKDGKFETFKDDYKIKNIKDVYFLCR